MVSRALLPANDNSELIAHYIGDQPSCANVIPLCLSCRCMPSATVCESCSGIVHHAKIGVIEIPVADVSDILTISRHNIRPVPAICPEPEKQYARGILATDKRMVCPIEPVGLFPDTESEAA